MKILVKNFGPIKEATIEVKPLTLIIGKNNLGKSYLAQLINTLHTLAGGRHPLLDRSLPSARLPLWMQIFSSNEVEQIIKGPPPDNAADYISDIAVKKYCQKLPALTREELEKNFGMQAQDLVNLNSSNSEITVFPQDTPSFRILTSKDGKSKAELIGLEEMKKRLSGKISKYATGVFAPRRIDDRFGSAVSMLFEVDKIMKAQIFGEMKGVPIYLPAGRAGWLESYETITKAFYTMAPMAPTREIHLPGLPIMPSNLILILMSLLGKKGPISEVADNLKEILGGEILFQRDTEKGISSISITYSFEFNGKKSSIDIIHAASMIKELAPLYLIIREVVRPNDCLIIEEPESHLHPGAQVKFAEIIVKLVNKGVQVIITTHSDLMLRKIAQLVRQHNLKKQAAIYSLKEGEGGCTSHELEIPEAGVLEEIPTFDDVIRDLYEGEISLLYSKNQLEKR